MEEERKVIVAKKKERFFLLKLNSSNQIRGRQNILRKPEEMWMELKRKKKLGLQLSDTFVS